MKKPSNIKLAYLAGLLDTKGSIFISKAKARHGIKGNFEYVLRIRLGSKNKKLVEYFTRSFNLMKPRLIKSTKQGWRDYWQIVTGSNRALEILEQLFPYIQVKKKQATLALKFQRNRPKGSQTRFRGKEQKRLKTCYLKMRKLNREGKV